MNVKSEKHFLFLFRTRAKVAGALSVTTSFRGFLNRIAELVRLATWNHNNVSKLFEGGEPSNKNSFDKLTVLFQKIKVEGQNEAGEENAQFTDREGFCKLLLFWNDWATKVKLDKGEKIHLILDNKTTWSSFLYIQRSMIELVVLFC